MHYGCCAAYRIVNNVRSESAPDGMDVMRLELRSFLVAMLVDNLLLNGRDGNLERPENTPDGIDVM